MFPNADLTENKHVIKFTTKSFQCIRQPRPTKRYTSTAVTFLDDIRIHIPSQ